MFKNTNEKEVCISIFIPNKHYQQPYSECCSFMTIYGVQEILKIILKMDCTIKYLVSKSYNQMSKSLILCEILGNIN